LTNIHPDTSAATRGITKTTFAAVRRRVGEGGKDEREVFSGMGVSENGYADEKDFADELRNL
jgi:hypothetical protein